MKKRMLLSACLMAGMIFGSPAMADVVIVPDPSEVAPDTLVLTQTTAGGRKPFSIVLQAIDKLVNPSTSTPVYYNATLKDPEKGTGDGTKYYRWYLSSNNLMLTSTTDPTLADVILKYNTADYVGHHDNDPSGTNMQNSGGGAIRYGYGTYDGITSDFTSNYTNIKSFYGGSDNVKAYGSGGGAIWNTGTISGNIDGDFADNYVSLSIETYGSVQIKVQANGSGGGAIYNNSKISGNIDGDFTYNIANISTKQGYYCNKDAESQGGGGGAIYNNSTISGNIEGDFIGNSTTVSAIGYNGNAYAYHSGGGAIRSSGTISGNIDGDFIGNSATVSASGNNYAYAYNSGGGAIYNDSTISGNIEGDFIGNSTTVSANGSYRSYANSSGGGAIRNGGTIGAISGDFVSNIAIINATSSGEVRLSGTGGGAIHNINTIAGIIDSTFISNTTNRDGGAILNTGTFTNGITNTSFFNNTANQKGGAIYTTKNLTITADNGTTEFTGNYVTTDGGTTKNYEAIYVDSSSATLTLNAVNNGKIIMNDYINGTDGYTVAMTGDGTGTVNLNNDIKNANVTTSNVTLNMQDASHQGHAYNLLSLNSTNTNANIDINFATGTADKITTTNESTGTLTINNLLISGTTPTTFDDGYKLQILTNNNADSTLELALSEAVQAQLEAAYLEGDKNVTHTDVAAVDENWSTKLYEYSDYSNYDTLGLVKTGTTYDSIGKIHVEGGTKTLIDTLNSSNTLTGTRTFSTTDPEGVYEVISDLETAGTGTMTINGAVSDENMSKINAQGHQLFTIGDDTTLTINNVEIKNAKADTAAITIDGTGEVNLNNVTFTDNTTDVNNDNELNITGGTVTINNGITGTGDTTVDGGSLVIADTSNGLTQSNLTVKSGSVTSDLSKLNISSGSIKNDGTLDFTGDEITLNITKDTTGTGVVKFNNGDMKINSTISDNTVEFTTGILTFGNPAENIANANLKMNGGTINLISDTVETLNMQNLNLASDFNMAVDVDLAAGKMDQITASTYNLNGNNINVVGMNIMTDAVKDSTTVPFADDNLKANVVNQVTEVGDGVSNPYQTTAFSPIYKYDVSYDPSNGNFTFAGGPSGGGDFNPAVLSEPAVAQANVMAATNIVNNYAFHSVDTTSFANSHGRLSSRYLNRYAIAEEPIKDDLNTNNPLFIEPEHEGVWFKPFVSFENIPLRNGPKVNTTTYGALIGYDSKVFNHKHGWDGVWTGYVGYTGASTHYTGVDSISNGGLMGATYSLYKGGFFNATTLTAGAMNDQVNTMYGKDNLTTLYAGVGNKTGYNWAFKEGLFVVQPSVLLSYTFANTFDYTNAAGVRIDSDPLHTIQISPGIKFFMNTKNGWQPYIGVNMMWNIMGNTHTRANGVRLPEMSVKPYVQYGVGVQKVMKDHFTAYGQAMIQNGGRNGISLTAGFKWCIGRDRKNHTVKTNGVRTVLK